MTLSTTNGRADATGNGNVSQYSFSYRIFSASDLQVTVLDPDTQEETTLVLDTDYSVPLSSLNNSAGGVINLIDDGQDWIDGDGNLLSDWDITILRVRPITQITSIRNQESFFAGTHEDVFDKLVMTDQYLKDLIDRSIKLPVTEAGTALKTTIPTVEERASKVFGWDSDGNPSAVTSVGSVTVSSYMETLLDDTTSAAARATLGISLTTDFLALTDTPDSYTSQGSKLVRVNAGATALEFLDPTTDFLTQYIRGAGRAGGQTLTGGTGSADALVLKANSHTGDGNITFLTDNTTERGRVLGSTGALLWGDSHTTANALAGAVDILAAEGKYGLSVEFSGTTQYAATFKNTSASHTSHAVAIGVYNTGAGGLTTQSALVLYRNSQISGKRVAIDFQLDNTVDPGCSYGRVGMEIETVGGAAAIGAGAFVVEVGDSPSSYTEILWMAEAGIFINKGGLDIDTAIRSLADDTCLVVNGGEDTVCVGAGATADSAKFYVSGKISCSGEAEINGALNHDGSTVGFYGVTPASRSTGWTITNDATDRSFDANADSTLELADVVATLIRDLAATGIIGAVA